MIYELFFAIHTTATQTDDPSWEESPFNISTESVVTDRTDDPPPPKLKRTDSVITIVKNKKNKLKTIIIEQL